jgi:hypothetical protein
MSNKTKTTLLIDADVLAFEASVVAEESINWKDELWTVHADMALAKARVVNQDRRVPRTIKDGECSAVLE